MNSPLPPSPSAYSPQLGWPALQTPSNLQPGLSGSLDATALANPLSSLRRSIDRRRTVQALQRGSPQPGGFIGLTLALYARDAGRSDSGASPFASVADLSDAVSGASASSQQMRPGAAALDDSLASASVSMDPEEAILDFEQPADAPSSAEEASIEDVLGDMGTASSPEQRSACEAQGSISFGNAFTHTDVSVHEASWSQDEGSVSFGCNLTCSETLADTPPFCPPPGTALDQASGTARDGGRQHRAAAEPTPAKSSKKAAGASEGSFAGSFLAAGWGGTPSSRHSFGPAHAIRSISLMPASPQRQLPEQRSLSPAPIRMSFRQAHGLLEASKHPSNGGPTQHAAASSQARGQSVQQQQRATDDEEELVVYDEAMLASQGSPALSASLQHIFDEALAQVPSPAPSSLGSSAKAPPKSSGRSSARASAAVAGEAGHVTSSVQQAPADAAAGRSPTPSDLSLPGDTADMLAEGRSASPRVLVLDNPLSSAPASDTDSKKSQEESAALAAAASPGTVLLQMANPRRSLQSALALAASLGSGILGSDPLSPSTCAAAADPDQGHLVFSPAAGVPGAT